MAKRLLFTAVLILALLTPALCGAADGDTAGTAPRTANTVSDCGTDGYENLPPWNCMFLEEPIGGERGVDMYLVSCDLDGRCSYALYQGGSYDPEWQRVVQALLTQDPNRPHEGSLGILFNYLRLVYNFMSGLIIGIVVLFSVIGGIEMITSSGDEGKYSEGKARIQKAIIGMILWFTASLVLYFINPTFFTFLS